MWVRGVSRVISRRSFLTLLGFAGVAPFATKLVYEPARFLLPPEPAAVDGSLLGLTTAIERLMCERLGLPYLVINGVPWGAEPVRLTSDGTIREGETQFYAAAGLPLEKEHDVRSRYVEPIAETLADYARHRGLRQLRRPDVIRDDGGAHGSGIETAYGHLVRAARVYNPLTDQALLRFDVIGRAA